MKLEVGIREVAAAFLEGVVPTEFWAFNQQNEAELHLVITLRESFASIRDARAGGSGIREGVFVSPAFRRVITEMLEKKQKS